MRKKINKWALSKKNFLTPIEFGIIKCENIYHFYKKGQIVRVGDMDDEGFYTCHSLWDNSLQFIEQGDLQRL